MECKVLCENTALEVELTITMAGTTCYEVLKSKNINFQDLFTFQVKHIRFNTQMTNNFSGHRSIEYQNIVLISIKQIDKSELMYKIQFSCPEFSIEGMIFYNDETNWRVINENKNQSTYKFHMIFHVQPKPNIKFSALYEDDNLTDFQLKGQDGAVDIHKAFLAAVCSHFKSMLVKEQGIASLEIPETLVNTLIDFKKYIYLGVLPDENLKDLLVLASYFKLHWLEIQCVDKIMSNMSATDAINLMEFALEHKHMSLFLGIMDQVQKGTLNMSVIRKHYLTQ